MGLAVQLFTDEAIMGDIMNARRRVGTETLDSETPPLTAEQLEELRKRLEERRASLLGNIERGREQERDNTRGRDVGDEMDEANMEEEAAVTSKLLERDVHLLVEIDRALGKMREGTYGTCEGTGEPIGFSRLSLRPWARYSVEYQEELERRARTGGGM
jgi:DnaK suppressor protein